MVKKKKLNKTGNKTLRLFQQTDFAVDFWSRQGRMFYNGWIEKAIEAYADQLSDETDVNWREVYDPDDSVRQLRVFALNPSFYPFSDEELEERAFVLEHHAFFLLCNSSLSRFCLNSQLCHLRLFLNWIDSLRILTSQKHVFGSVWKFC